MKFQVNAYQRGVPMRAAVGRMKAIAETGDEARILALLYEDLSQGHPIELPWQDIVIGQEQVSESAGSVRDASAEAGRAGASDAIAAATDPAGAHGINDTPTIASRADDAE